MTNKVYAEVGGEWREIGVATHVEMSYDGPSAPAPTFADPNNRIPASSNGDTSVRLHEFKQPTQLPIAATAARNEDYERVIAALVHMLGGSVMLDANDLLLPNHDLTVTRYKDPFMLRLENKRGPND